MRAEYGEFSSVAWHVTPTQVNGFYFGHFGRAFGRLARSPSLSLSLYVATLATGNCLYEMASCVYLGHANEFITAAWRQEAELVAHTHKKMNREKLFMGIGSGIGVPC